MGPARRLSPESTASLASAAAVRASRRPALTRRPASAGCDVPGSSLYTIGCSLEGGSLRWWRKRREGKGTGACGRRLGLGVGLRP